MPLIDIAPFEILNPMAERAVRAKVFGLMLWPNAEAKRFDFVLSNVRDAAEQLAVDNSVGLTLDAETSRLMRERTILPPRPMMEAAWQNVVHGAAKSPDAPQRAAGEVAGQVLIHATNRVVEGHRNIGLNDCLERVSEDLRREGAMNARPKDLKRYWHEFRPVAPLWAAWLSIVRWGENGIQPRPGQFMPALLMKAELFRMEGEAITHRNAAEPLLPPGSVWQLSEPVKECLHRSQGT